MQIGIEAMRVERKMTRKEVSEATGFPVDTIRNWESGRTDIPVKKAKVLLELYGFKFEDIKI